MTTKILLVLLLISFRAPAQQGSFQDTLLDHMTGNWIMKGDIAGKQVTHDVTVDWVLAHQYLQLHDLSREKDSAGAPEYEAIVYFGWDPRLRQYACLWLDVTGGSGLSVPVVMGHAVRKGSTLPFVFSGDDVGVIHNTFIYDYATDVWHWEIDNESEGTRSPFARVTLTRSGELPDGGMK